MTLKASGEKTASATIHTGPGVFRGLCLNHDGTASMEVVLYDALSATGAVLWRQTLPAGEVSGGVMVEDGVAFGTGCYLAITGGVSPKVNVYYTVG